MGLAAMPRECFVVVGHEVTDGADLVFPDVKTEVRLKFSGRLGEKLTLRTRDQQFSVVGRDVGLVRCKIIEFHRANGTLGHLLNDGTNLEVEFVGFRVGGAKLAEVAEEFSML